MLVSTSLVCADRVHPTNFVLCVGRNVPQSLIPDIFSVSEDNPYERPESCGFNLETDIGKKFNSFVELLRSLCIYKQGQFSVNQLLTVCHSFLA